MQFKTAATAVLFLIKKLIKVVLMISGKTFALLAALLGEPEQVECLAQNLYFEARNQSAKGQMAVVHVTLNRVYSKHFPNTICGVVKDAVVDSNGNPKKHKCQFSWYCDGQPDVIKNKKKYEEVKQTAIASALAYKMGVDITDGSKWYHTHEVDPYWATSYNVVAQIDDHIFYKD